MDIRQINQAIITNIWTDDELNSMLSAINIARTSLQKQKIRKIAIGSEVKWRNSKTGHIHAGIVEKIAQKFVTVRTGIDCWKVPANMLEVA